jgi:DNA mismatch repair protein MutL
LPLAKWSKGRLRLKELVENSIDAGREITVRLSDGGLDAIEVTDDGCGMAPDQMALALERTRPRNCPMRPSNGHDAGFRGEALPSIASVARDH